MQTTIQYRLRAYVDIYETDPGCVLVSIVDGKALSLGPDALAIVKQLKTGWLTEDAAAEGADDLSRIYFAFILLRKGGMLDARLMKGEVTLFSMSPSPEDSAFKDKIDPGNTYYLSRYAFLRRYEDHLLLESPLTPCRIAVYSENLLGMLHQLCTGLRLDITGEAAGLFLSVLLAVDMAGHAEKQNAEDPMDFWQFHDLLFYSRTLNGRHVYPLGGTYRFKGRRPSLSPIREPVSGDIMELPEPSGTMAERLRLPFSDTLGRRRSKREFSDAPLSIEEFGAFLHAAAKIREVMTIPEYDDKVTARPFPGGGARHPLEIYPLIRRCAGIAPGAYRYDPLDHRLEKVAADPTGLEEMLEENPHEFIGVETPQVTLNISARIGRTAWKYASIAYKIINQDLGCLYQTFYLVATALGLSPCALGSVDTERLGRILGIDWREEPFIGAFTLGK